MASKKKPSMEESIEIFKDVMKRIGLTTYSYMNRILVSKNKKEKTIFIVPEFELWNKLMKDETFKPLIHEVNVETVEGSELYKLSVYFTDMENDWFEIPSELIYDGTIYKLILEEREYDIPLNKNMIPLKLRKAEFNNIFYRVWVDKTITIALKKKFIYKLEDGRDFGFSIVRLFLVP